MKSECFYGYGTEIVHPVSRVKCNAQLEIRTASGKIYMED